MLPKYKRFFWKYFIHQFKELFHPIIPHSILSCANASYKKFKTGSNQDSIIIMYITCYNKDLSGNIIHQYSVRVTISNYEQLHFF